MLKTKAWRSNNDKQEAELPRNCQGDGHPDRGRCHYCGGGLFFSGAQPYIRQQYFRPWHRAF